MFAFAMRPMRTSGFVAAVNLHNFMNRRFYVRGSTATLQILSNSRLFREGSSMIVVHGSALNLCTITCR